MPRPSPGRSRRSALVSEAALFDLLEQALEDVLLGNELETLVDGELALETFAQFLDALLEKTRLALELGAGSPSASEVRP